MVVYGDANETRSASIAQLVYVQCELHLCTPLSQQGLSNVCLTAIWILKHFIVDFVLKAFNVVSVGIFVDL